MKTKALTNKEIFSIGLMLFALFFGAGNMIFPPLLGQQAGTHT
jgi:branched-chain amino acid:cation transporter, LIVCS family